MTYEYLYSRRELIRQYAVNTLPIVCACVFPVFNMQLNECGLPFSSCSQRRAETILSWTRLEESQHLRMFPLTILKAP